MEISARDGSILRTLAEVPKEHTWNELRFNEGKVAPGGVFILGRMHYEGPMGGPPGRLYKCVSVLLVVVSAGQLVLLDAGSCEGQALRGAHREPAGRLYK